jgi:hypothetical protein
MASDTREESTLLFGAPADFEAWLAEHCADAGGVWLKLAKKDSGRAGIGGCALFRVDRWPETPPRRVLLAAALHPAVEAKPLVDAEP